MYLSFYRLNVKPFQMSTDPDFLWLGEKHKEALSTMKYAIFENKGVLALTGDVGTGKTTLINALIQSLGKDTIAATIYDPGLDVVEFFNMIAAAFKMEKVFENKGQFILQFRQFLKKARERKQKVLLIIDEAQAANADLLEEIRMLSNLEEEHIRLLNIFFVGQNEFIDVLQQYSNRALKQRITMRYHIDPLTLNETEFYIKHRLRVSGAGAPIFTAGAIAEIFTFSEGYPRLINIICDHALLSGYVREVELIGADVIRECSEELEVIRKEGERGSEPREYDLRNHLLRTGVVEPEVGLQAHDTALQFHEDPLSVHGPETTVRLSSEETEFSGQDASVIASTEKPRHRKKSMLPATIGILFVIVAGLVLGYQYFLPEDDKTLLPTFLSQKPEEKRHAVKTEPENHGSPMVSSDRETVHASGSIEAGKVGESRYFIARSPEPTLYKEVSPKETESGLSEKNKSEDAPSMHALPGGAEQTESTTIGILTPKKPPQQTQPVKKTFEPPVKPRPSKAVQKDITEHVATTKTPKPRPKPVQTQVQSSKERYPKTTIPEKSPVEKGSKDVSSMPAIKTVPPETAAEPIKSPEEKKTESRKDQKVFFLARSMKKPEAGIEDTAADTDLQTRLGIFLTAYCRTYEKKDLNTFRAFFTPDAVEHGKPFSAQLPQYRRNFETIDAMNYRIDVQGYDVQGPTGGIKLDGIFHVRAKLKEDGEWQQKSGGITMTLAPHEDSFKIRELDYFSNTAKTVGPPPTGSEIKSASSAVKTLLQEELQPRLKAFLKTYCRTYEKKDLDTFSTFFVPDALETGKPFSAQLPLYRRNFERIDAMTYRIDVQRYAIQEGTGLVRIEGIFHVRARLNDSAKWRENQGDISLVLVPFGKSFKVKRLDY